jgi:hypothetical protein
VSFLRGRAVRAAFVVALLFSAVAAGHDVASSDKQFVESVAGPAFIPFLYLGAKHMVTGYDHVLFLIGVVFFLYRLRDVVIYVSLFTIGHSLTLMGGVLSGVGANAHIVDAIIGLSVVYKGLEARSAFRSIRNWRSSSSACFMAWDSRPSSRTCRSRRTACS